MCCVNYGAHTLLGNTALDKGVSTERAQLVRTAAPPPLRICGDRAQPAANSSNEIYD